MIGIKGGADVGAGNDLLSVISKDKVGEDVALSLGNATLVPRCSQLSEG
jgi:hypothetical protein